jgi:hypothetical protein
MASNTSLRSTTAHQHDAHKAPKRTKMAQAKLKDEIKVLLINTIIYGTVLAITIENYICDYFLHK